MGYAMELDEITFVGPPIDDAEILADLPVNLSELLQQVNGFIQFHGGLHVRGACREPAWHSLRDAWVGARAFHGLYPAIRPVDIPFAEDCMGGQFLLRDGRVVRLSAETGELEALDLGLAGFLQAVQDDPIGFLSLQPFLQIRLDGGELEQGQLLIAAPPFCTKEAAKGVRLAVISSDEARRFLAHLAAHIRDVADGESIVFRVVE